MSNELKMLQSGLKLLEQKNYSEAVNLLEKYCQTSEAISQTQSKEYLQGKMGLAKAYYCLGKQEEARILCQQLAENNHPQVQAWAQRILASLYSNSSVTPSTQSQANPVVEPVIESSVPPSTTVTDVEAKETKTPESLTKTSGYVQAVETVTKMEMRTLNEFKTFLKEYLLPDLKAFENLRKQALISVVVVGIIATIISLTMIVLLLLNIIALLTVGNITLLRTIFIFFLIFWGSIWGWIFLYSSSMETYTKEFKTKINQKIVDFINTNETLRYCIYSSEKDLEYAMSIFNNSQIFHGLFKPNKLRQHEWITGKVNQAEIFLGEINAEVEIQLGWVKYLNFMEQWRVLMLYQVPHFIARAIIFFLIPLHIVVLIFKFGKGFPYLSKKIFKGRNLLYKDFQEEVLINEVSRKPVFKGFLSAANLPKKFIGKTIVISNKLQPSETQTLKPQKVQVIKIKDAEFTKLFTVYSNNQNASQNILSTDLMAKLIKLRKLTGKNVYISFIENTLYIAIEYGEDVFEPNLFKSMLNITPLQQYFDNLQLMLGIVEDFT